MEEFEKTQEQQEIQQPIYFKPINKTLSIILSIVGSIIGLIPAILVVFFTDTLYGILFALPPIAAYFGYKLGKAEVTNFTTVLVIVETLVVCALAIVIEYALVAAAIGVSLGEVIALPEAEFGKSLLQVLLFACIGIAVSWNIIKKKY